MRARIFIVAGVFSFWERRLRLTGFSVFLCEMGVRTGHNKRFVFYVCCNNIFAVHELGCCYYMPVSWFSCNTRCLHDCIGSWLMSLPT